MIRSKDADPLYRFVRNNKAGYIDRSGTVVIKPTFDGYGKYGGEFHNGLLETSSISGGRYVDKTGQLAIKKEFYRGWDFSEGLAVAMLKDGERWGYIDGSGEFAISPRFETYPKGYVYSFSEGFARIQVANRYGYIDRSGEFSIPPQYLHASDFHDGIARVIIEGPCGYVSDSPCPDVKVLPESIGQDVPPCKFAFIDRMGNLISAERYEKAKDFAEGLAPMRRGARWGYIDKQGRTVIEPMFDDAEPFSDGLACIQQGKLYGYIDHTGVVTIPPQFKYAEGFAEGLAVVGDFSRGDFYYINKFGQQALPDHYVLASHFYQGIAHVKLKTKNQRSANYGGMYTPGRFAYITLSGKEIFVYEGDR